MIIVFRSTILACSIILVVMYTVLLWVPVYGAVKKIKQGGQRDSGMFPKRSRNVNAYYVPTPDPSTSAYQPYHPAVTANPLQSGKPARIGIPKTTACPIFRAQDDGSTNPLLIG